MTEFSMFPWETQTGTGDGATSYTQDQANNFFRYLDVRDPTTEGIVKFVLNELACTFNNHAVTPTIDVDTGVAVCYGRYWNTATVTLDTTGALFVPIVGTTGGRVVLEADWSTNTIRAVVIMNTDGVAAYPAITQTAGTLWQLPLYNFTITTLGVFTAVDVRVNRVFTGEVRDVDGDTSLIAESVSNVSMLNRTRSVFLPAFTGYDVTGAAEVQRDSGGAGVYESFGVVMATAVDTYCGGSWQLPTDYATADPAAYVLFTPIWFAVDAGVGNIYQNGTLYIAPAGSPYNTRTATPTAGVTPATPIGDIQSAAGGISDSSPLPVIGDFYNVRFIRQGTNVGDTYGGRIIFMGWQITYLADM